VPAGEVKSASPAAVQAMTELVDPLLARHAAFWRCEPADRPLLGMSRWSQVSASQFDWGLPAAEGVLSPDMIDVARLLPQYETFYERQPLDDDLCWPAMPPTAIPWLEAMLGCPIRYSLEAGTISAESVPAGRLAELESVDVDSNAWLLKLLEFIDGLAGLARGRFAVGMPLMRGPWDLVSALIGATELYLALHDRPDDLQALATTCGGLWVRVAERLQARIPRWHGGCVGFLGLWAPGFVPMAQDDASVSVSAGMYGRVMRSVDANVVRDSGTAIFHLHSTGLQVLDHVLDFLDGRALNVDVDPSGPAIAKLIPNLRRVQACRVPLHLLTFDRLQARALGDLLSPAGLAITYQPMDARADRVAHPGGVR
jgi:hypothetical protein